MSDTVHRFAVEEADAGERLDRFLVARLPDQSRSALQRFVKQGRVEIAEPGAAPFVPDKPRHLLRAGAEVSVRIPEDLPFTLRAEDVPLPILHSDDEIVVVDKPAGMVVHPSPGHAGGTIVNALLHHEGPLTTRGGEERPGLVHRLDRDTTGVMVVARTDRAHRELSRQFKARETKKVYLAIVRGVPRAREGRIDGPIGRSTHHRKRMAVTEDGREAMTEYEVLEAFERHALVLCRPRTGRTHQIRVHLHHIGAPILCDSLYAPQRAVTASGLRDRAPFAGEPALLSRHALHARSLAFTHPGTGEPVRFEARLPADMEAVLEALRGPATI